MKRRPPRAAIVTLGCAKNQADTDLLAGQLLREGMEIVGEPRDADAVLINTCAFLTASQQESIEAILDLAEGKRANPGQRLVVLGCLSQRHGASLMEEIPEIDWIVGPGEVHAIAHRLRSMLDRGGNGRQSVDLGGLDRVEEKWEIRVVAHHPHSAFIKISEGCDRTCSFCIIPALRGPHRSRTRESIVREVETLVAAGVKEFNLVAQESTAYGVDLHGKPALADLLGDLESIRGIGWIRLHYAYPATWRSALFARFREAEHLVPYVDMPIQHISDSVLRSMRRPGATATRRLLERMRDEIPGVSVRTTLIAGYPGETEEEFEELLAFVRAYRFDHLGVFAYSREDGTHAGKRGDQIPLRERRRRRGKLLAAQRDLSRARLQEMVGQRLTLLVDAPHPRGGWIARHAGQAPEVDGITHLSSGATPGLAPGMFVEAIVTSAGSYDLAARLVNSTEETR